MATIGIPLADEAMKLVREFLEERQSERALLIELIGRTQDQTLIDRLIEQHLQRQAIDLENRQWWQARARALGDVFEAETWERIRETLIAAFDFDPGEDPPSPAPEPEPDPDADD